jgi:hypothetical protein
LQEVVNLATRRRLSGVRRCLGSSGRPLHAHDPIAEIEQNSDKDLSELAGGDCFLGAFRNARFHLHCRKSCNYCCGQGCRTRSDNASVAVPHGQARCNGERGRVRISPAGFKGWLTLKCRADTLFGLGRHIGDDVFYPLSEIFLLRTPALQATACGNSR